MSVAAGGLSSQDNVIRLGMATKSVPFKKTGMGAILGIRYPAKRHAIFSHSFGAANIKVRQAARWWIVLSE
jgi:hypothetical protein